MCRKDSFITHRAFCDALAEESARLSAATNSILAPNPNLTSTPYLFSPLPPPSLLPFSSHHRHFRHDDNQVQIKHESLHIPLSSPPLYQDRPTLMTSPFGSFQVSAAAAPPPLSATALLQKAATMGAAGHVGSTMAHLDMQHVASAWQKTSDGLTRDFLGLTNDQCCGGGSGGGGSGNGGVREVLPLVKFSAYERDHNSLLKHHGFGFTETCSGWGNC